MRGRLCAISLLGLVAVCSASAQTSPAERPSKASSGKMKPSNESSSTGSGAQAATPEDAAVAYERDLDERRATESKQRIRKRPGYRNEVPSPRV